MRTTKKILFPLFLIIVFIIFSILLKIVIAGYKPPFGGEYTNLCGSGYDADRYLCDADCNIDSGTCRASSEQWMYVFICDGWHRECVSNNSRKFKPGESAGVLNFATPNSNKTVQIDVFNKECDKDGKWTCLGNPPPELKGYIVWYSGQPSQQPPSQPSPQLPLPPQSSPQPPSQPSPQLPPPPPPPPASSQGLKGICSPVIINKISYPNNSNQWSPAGQTSQLNSQLENSNLVKKGDTLYLDVKLENRGTTATAQCKYRTCESEESVTCCVRYDRIYYECGTPKRPRTCERWVCGVRGSYKYCSGWSYHTETISNPSVCSVNATIGVSINSLKKFLDLSWINTFFVDARSTIQNSSFTLSGLDIWASSLGWNGNIKPQRHGYFYLDSKKTGGAVYNVPQVITRSDDSFSSSCSTSPPSLIGRKDYYACQECTWTGSKWSCPWSGDKSFYTVFNEPYFAVNVEPGRIEFYTQPSDVAPYLSVEKSQAPTPSGVKTPLRDWIAGFPFKINYGVNILGPGKFAKDIGDFWFELTGNPLPFTCSISPSQKTNVSDFSTRQTTTCTPQKAGSLTITSKHNADDEKVSIKENNKAIGDVESTSQTITIYRYLCYQGFCWECPNEPALRGIYLDVKGAGCQAVEDAKCQTYINKSCKAGVRE
jgi:hypothetical protein